MFRVPDIELVHLKCYESSCSVMLSAGYYNFTSIYEDLIYSIKVLPSAYK